MVRGEGQENENGPDGAGLVDIVSSVDISTVTGSFSAVISLPSFSGWSELVETDREPLVFRRKYAPSPRTVALGTLHPLIRPLLPTRPIIVEPTPSSPVLTLPVVVALRGIFLFFLFFKLKSSRPRLDAVEAASSPSSSESDDS